MKSQIGSEILLRDYLEMNDVIMIKGVDVMTREDLLAEIDRIADSIADDPKSWENPTLERYLDAMYRWLDDVGDTFDDLPKWDFVALLLGAAKVYE